MNRDEAISILQKCTWLDQACKNIGNEYWEDLRQEFWIAFLQAKPQEFQHENNLKFYSIRIILNLKNDPSDRYIKKNNPTKIDGDIIDSIENNNHSLFELKDAIINRMPMYERCLFRLHESGQSIRKIHRNTGIDRTELSRVINHVKETIKDAAKYI